jgi:prepilin-type N-terminal cleavage/methylation domain-containing protein
MKFRRFRGVQASLSRRGIVRSRLGRASRDGREADQGFTLVELAIVVTILPLVIGALGYGLITAFSLQNSVSHRLSDSGDAQVISSNFIKDVQSASLITTSATVSSPNQCGPGTQLLGLEWATGETVSYVEQVQSGSTYALLRNYCPAGSSTPTSSSTIAYDLLAPCPSGGTTTTTGGCQTIPIAYQGSTVLVTSGGWVSVQGITKVNFPIYETDSNYNYTLSALPAASGSTPAGNLGAPTNGLSCGFALPNTGTYASTLCFASITNTIIASAEGSGNSKCTSGVTGVNASVAVPGGYTMSYCLSITLGNSNDVIVAAAFPTWGGSFLGNDINGTPFYTGVGCPDSDSPTVTSGGYTLGTPSCINPAIYQTTPGATDTVTLSNIIVTDPQGNDATGYEIVAADAETTDPSEYIIWTSSLPTSSPFVFNQSPDTPTSPEGDACNEPSGYSEQNPDENSSGQSVTNGLGLTGVGSTQVECQSTWQSQGNSNGTGVPRTGTVLLSISPTTTNGVTAPVTISANMHGAGLEGIAFGLLLP